ncbi:HAD family hydrolase [Endozoicomonas atrinae]|uniref:HAD family hydrolase n=1 Tax=Endozoicomonas atrinae TaxID=1333660 RepID=UPI000825BFA8|nr:HAD-IA family hydrolase [Endozoicomonas atrinae]
MSDRRIDKYALIVFDWDGTLIDSIPNISEALRRAALAEALPVLDNALYRSVVGLSLGPALQRLYPELSDEGNRRLRVAYKHHHSELEQSPSRPFPGVEEGVTAISKSNAILAVATGKRRPGLQRSMVVNGFESFFDASLTADDARSKPDPDMIEQLMARFQVQPGQVLMIGDSGFDMEMAHRAGADALAVTYGAGSHESLQAFEPVYVAENFESVLVWLGIKSETIQAS